MIFMTADPLVWIGILFAFCLGSALGSFANVLVIRMKAASTLWGRSQCMTCKTVIKPRHLVPIFSWIALRGRCAACGSRIHFQYPIVEALGGLLVMIAYVRHPFFGSPVEFGAFLFESFFVLDLLVLSVFDFRWKLLPIEFMVGSGILFGAWSVLAGRISPLSAVIGLVFGSAFLGLQVWISHGKWLGDGDPWMGGMLGIILGWPGIAINFYLTYVLGGILAFILLVGGFVKRGARIPFGPLLAGGALATLYVGAWMEALVRRLW